MTFNRAILISYLILQTLFLTSCNTDPQEPETLFNASERHSDDVNLSASIKHVVITNPIGHTILYGVMDPAKLRYVLDRSVWAKSRELAQSEMKKINFVSSSNADTLFCEISSPSTTESNYICNLSLDGLNNLQYTIKMPNKGIQTSYLTGNLKTQTDAWQSTVDNHSGSLEAHSTDGDISAKLIIPGSGYCKCYSNNGDITVKIPPNTSARITLLSPNGTIEYRNLNISITSSSPGKIEGKMGSGNSEIYLESKTGKIILESF